MSKKYIDINDLEDWEDADDLEMDFKYDRRRSTNNKLSSIDPIAKSELPSKPKDKKHNNDKEN